MIKWYSEDIEPTKSKNIVIRINKNHVEYIGDYSHNIKNDSQIINWKSFRCHMLLTFHTIFEWCYWEDVEKVLLK